MKLNQITGERPMFSEAHPKQNFQSTFWVPLSIRADKQEFEKVFNMIDIKTKEFFFKAFGHKKVTAEKKGN